VGVPGDELVVDPARHVVDVERVALGRDLRVERDLEQQVAQLLTEVVIGPRLHGVDDLGGLFDEVVQQRRVRLLHVPGTPQTQGVHDGDEPAELIVPRHVRSHAVRTPISPTSSPSVGSTRCWRCSQPTSRTAGSVAR
jgi:hypothetical protein